MKQKLIRANLSLPEIRLINYLVGKRLVGKNGFCFIGKSRRYNAVQSLQQKAVIKIISVRGRIVTFCFTRAYRNQSKI
ncbi:MAG TPA: hypothetical protein VKG26_13005 [Bacteroidia bacterium]|nr:hypothetical protein [Bacteroidia bacterium]